MFESLDAIPVVFGPNEADVWMIAATLLSFSASLVLGVAALKNGLAATRIAKEASDRDEAHRAETAVKEEQRVRDEVALRMLSAFAALEAWNTIDPSMVYEERERIAIQKIDTRQDARARIDHYSALSEEKELRFWFDRALAAHDMDTPFDKTEGAAKGRFLRQMSILQRTVVSWSRRQVNVREMLNDESGTEFIPSIC